MKKIQKILFITLSISLFKISAFATRENMNRINIERNENENNININNMNLGNTIDENLNRININNNIDNGEYTKEEIEKKLIEIMKYYEGYKSTYGYNDSIYILKTMVDSIKSIYIKLLSLKPIKGNETISLDKNDIYLTMLNQNISSVLFYLVMEDELSIFAETINKIKKYREYKNINIELKNKVKNLLQDYSRLSDNVKAATSIIDKIYKNTPFVITHKTSEFENISSSKTNDKTYNKKNNKNKEKEELQKLFQDEINIIENPYNKESILSIKEAIKQFDKIYTMYSTDKSHYVITKNRKKFIEYLSKILDIKNHYLTYFGDFVAKIEEEIPTYYKPYEDYVKNIMSHSAIFKQANENIKNFLKDINKISDSEEMIVNSTKVIEKEIANFFNEFETQENKKFIEMIKKLKILIEDMNSKNEIFMDEYSMHAITQNVKSVQEFKQNISTALNDMKGYKSKMILKKEYEKKIEELENILEDCNFIEKYSNLFFKNIKCLIEIKSENENKIEELHKEFENENKIEELHKESENENKIEELHKESENEDEIEELHEESKITSKEQEFLEEYLERIMNEWTKYLKPSLDEKKREILKFKDNIKIQEVNKNTLLNIRNKIEDIKNILKNLNTFENRFIKTNPINNKKYKNIKKANELFENVKKQHNEYYEYFTREKKNLISLYSDIEQIYKKSQNETKNKIKDLEEIVNEWTKNLEPSLKIEKNKILKFKDSIMNQKADKNMFLDIDKKTKDIKIILDKLNTFENAYITDNSINNKEYKGIKLFEDIKKQYNKYYEYFTKEMKNLISLYFDIEHTSKKSQKETENKIEDLSEKSEIKSENQDDLKQDLEEMVDEWTKNLKPSLDEEKRKTLEFIHNIFQNANKHMLVNIGNKIEDIENILKNLNTFENRFIKTNPINNKKYKNIKKANELFENVKKQHNEYYEYFAKEKNDLISLYFDIEYISKKSQKETENKIENLSEKSKIKSENQDDLNQNLKENMIYWRENLKPENLKPSLDKEKREILKFKNSIKIQKVDKNMLLDIGRKIKDINIILDKLNTFKNTYITNNSIIKKIYKDKKIANELFENVKKQYKEYYEYFTKEMENLMSLYHEIDEYLFKKSKTK